MDNLQALLAKGGFELQQWASNQPEVINHLPTAARSESAELWIAQGLPDGQKSDTLSYKLRLLQHTQVTMHTIYKVLASQYDPS